MSACDEHYHRMGMKELYESVLIIDNMEANPRKSRQKSSAYYVTFHCSINGRKYKPLLDC